MPLFEIPKRTNKSNDLKVAKKSNTKLGKAPTTVKGGGGLMGKISAIQAMVEKHLGKYRDDYILIQDKQQLIDYIGDSIKQGVISIDTETTGLDPLLDDLAGICIYTPGNKAAYIPVNHVSYITNVRVADQLEVPFLKEQFNRIIQANIDIIMFNAKFDIRVLRHSIGLHDIYCTWDCYLAGRLLNENEVHKGLKALHKKYCLDGKGDAFSFDELFNGIPFTLIPIKTAYLYAANDPKITYELYEYQKQYLREDSDREDMRRLYWVMTHIEMPCVDATATMEDNGVLVDLNYQQELSVKYNQLLQEKLDTFNREVSKYDSKIANYKLKHPTVKLDNPINVKSPQQLAVLFYDILGVKVIDKKSPRGTGEEILSKLDNPIAKAILEYRTMSKLVDTYIDKLPDCINPNDGKVHCSFNQYGADTGRFSSSDPNMQNIPSHNKDIRKMFIASPGYVLMSSDYSQQEPSCLATFCKEAGSDKLFNARFKGNDLYSEVASACFNIPYEQCCEFDENGHKNPPEYKERRSQAKPVLLGILYGRGDASVAEQLDCSLEEAQQLKTNLFKKFPEIQQFERDSLEMGKELGYVTTVCGRKRRLPDLQLNEYDFSWKNGSAPDNDLLDFDSDFEESYDVPIKTIQKYLTQLHRVRFTEKRSVFDKADKEGIRIVDNGAKIAKATRQTVNARIQGSAADLTKLAMIDLNKSKRLKELGFRLLIQVHDEIIAECPEENVKECSKLLADTMSKAAEKILKMPFSCDVEITKEWYGTPIEIE